ncbi:uncharacterized protein [Venturia canescens]|uniref:uncharacterized protein isoform X2 n=1 Tax=Venturia canescens TaxID=32260 RepID=UPI001C9D063D|nr:uncharacterized protein LOC122409497 isoform X2 [Venturia canescens]
MAKIFLLVLVGCVAIEAAVITRKYNPMENSERKLEMDILNAKKQAIGIGTDIGKAVVDTSTDLTARALKIKKEKVRFAGNIVNEVKKAGFQAATGLTKMTRVVVEGGGGIISESVNFGFDAVNGGVSLGIEAIKATGKIGSIVVNMVGGGMKRVYDVFKIVVDSGTK